MLRQLLAIVAAGCTGCSRAPVESRPDKNGPAKKELVDISVSAPSGWLVGLRPDGSGGVGYGANGANYATFGPNTLDFTATIDAVRDLCVPERKVFTDFAVSFKSHGDTAISVVYFSDKDLARGIFEQALSATMTHPHAERLRQLREKWPPVPHNPRMQTDADAGRDEGE